MLNLVGVLALASCSPGTSAQMENNVPPEPVKAPVYQTAVVPWDTVVARDRDTLRANGCRSAAQELWALHLDRNLLRARVDSFTALLNRFPEMDRTVADSLFLADGRGAALHQALKVFSARSVAILGMDGTAPEKGFKITWNDAHWTLAEWHGSYFPRMPRLAVCQILAEEASNAFDMEERCIKKLLADCAAQRKHGVPRSGRP